MKNNKISKKIMANLVVTSILLSTTSIINANELNDINNHWAKKEIQTFIDKGYINGYPEDLTFRPENPITRAEFVKTVNKVFGYTQTTQISFKDVKKGEWYYSEVEKAVKAGYIKGYPEDNTFRPENPITREEAAKIIATIMKKEDKNLDKLQSYSDAKNVSDWAKEYVEGVLEAKYMNGYSENNTFRPTNNITRAEAVVTLNRTQNTDAVIKTMYTTAESLNIRSGPGTQYEKVGALPRNSKVEVLDITDNWAKIKFNNSYAYASMSYLSDTPLGDTLPTVPETPKYIDTPQHPGIIDESQDQNQGNIVLEKTISNETVTGLSIKSNIDAQVTYSIYSNGKWIEKSNGENATVENNPIEGIKVKLTNQEPNHHIFYRTKIKGEGWQAWVKDGKISGQVNNNHQIEDIEIREIIADNADEMVKPTIAVDIGHNVPRPVKAGATALYKEDDLTKAVGEKIVYRLRQQGYNVVETLPTGRYTQSDELKTRANIANLNESDKFISIHFNVFDGSASGTEAYYSDKPGAKTMAANASKKLSENFGFNNRGAKDGSHLAVLRLTNMPAILVEGCFIDSLSDMNKFIQKGPQAYEIMADSIIQGALN